MSSITDPRVEHFLPSLLDLLKSIEPDASVTVYYNTHTWVFYLFTDDTILFDTDEDANFIGRGNAVHIYSVLNQMLVRDCKATEAVKNSG